MIEPIKPIKLAAVTGEERLTQIGGLGREPQNIFDDVLGNAISALNGVSEVEFAANKLIDDYTVGKAELSDVLIATTKMSIAVQLAVTAITSTVNTFKEITQIPI